MFILLSMHLVSSEETGCLKQAIKHPFLQPSSLTDARSLQSDPPSKASASPLLVFQAFPIFFFLLGFFPALLAANVFRLCQAGPAYCGFFYYLLFILCRAYRKFTSSSLFVRIFSPFPPSIFFVEC